MTARIAVLASGGGSNLQALLDHLDELGVRRAGDVTLVVSNRADAGALERARAHGIATHVLPSDDALDAPLRQHDVDLVVLAGYLRFVPNEVTRRFRGRMLNVHPSLLPAFGGAGMFGARVHRAVIDAGVRVSGATVHFVDEQYDRGPIIAQWPVPVMVSDTPELLARRVLAVEHALLPRAVQAVATGRVVLDEDGRVRMNGLPVSPEAFVLTASAETRLADAVAAVLDS